MDAVNIGEVEKLIADRLQELGFAIEVDVSETGVEADLRATRADRDVRLLVDVRRSAPRSWIDGAARKRRDLRSWLLALPHVTAGEGSRLRERGIQYIDSGGNAWIDSPGLTLWIEGRRPAYAARAGVERPSRAFRPTGLRVIFALLSAPQLLDAPMRAIAAGSGVSLGAVSNTLADLKETGVMGEVGDQRHVPDLARLRDVWIEHYAATLRPSLEERRVAGPDPRWWTASDAADVLERNGMQLGGESALEALGRGLRAEQTVLYGGPPWRDVVRELRMPQDPGGDVVLRERFWDPASFGDGLTVPPLLILADAVAGGDEREIEIARDWHREFASV